MTPTRIQATVVAGRVGWIREMLARIQALPLDNLEEFQADARNVAASDSYLRRALEALLDLGRHITARGFGRAPAEYKEVAAVLEDVGVLSAEQATLLRRMAGYRNRLVHFYDEVSPRELYEICSGQIEDIESVLQGILKWINSNAGRIEGKL